MKRGRPKKVKEVKEVKGVLKVKGKRGRPKKVKVDFNEVDICYDHINPDCKINPANITNTQNVTETHSFCPDCGVELKNIDIFDVEMDENCETFGCPDCNQEITKDNEVTLTINKGEMKLDYNSLTITKLDE